MRLFAERRKWLRRPDQRQGRQFIRLEVSRLRFFQILRARQIESPILPDISNFCGNCDGAPGVFYGSPGVFYSGPGVLRWRETTLRVLPVNQHHQRRRFTGETEQEAADTRSLRWQLKNQTSWKLKNQTSCMLRILFCKIQSWNILQTW